MESLVSTGTETILLVRKWIPTETSLDLYAHLRPILDRMDIEHSGTYTVRSRWGEYVLPRKIFMCGDPGVTHTFGAIDFPVQPWLDAIIPIRDRIAMELGIRFNSCTINYYPDGSFFIKDHHDSGVKSPRNAIVTVSLGVSRTFVLKGPQTIKTIVHSGDIFMMLDAANQNWTHGIPKQKIIPVRGDPGRISLTFRDL